MANVSLLIFKPKTGFQSFVPAIHHWEIKPNQFAQSAGAVEYTDCTSARGVLVV